MARLETTGPIPTRLKVCQGTTLPARQTSTLRTGLLVSLSRPAEREEYRTGCPAGRSGEIRRVGASSEGNVGPGATPTTHSRMESGKTKTSKAKSGTTTGMISGSDKSSDSAPKNSDTE
jgi:hypothetical protein